jgi:FkbM family methyltransferase
MDLSKPSRARSLALSLARPLSRILSLPGIYNRFRLIDTYSNFLIGKGSANSGDMEDEIKAATKIIYRPNPTILDVGANVGKWSKMLLEKLPDAKIFMFEPAPTSQAAIRKLNLPNATLLPFAAGAKAEKAVLYSSASCDGSASLHARVDSAFATRTYESIHIETITIDEVIESKSLDFVDFMKMDIEGHELFALHGAQKALANRRIGGLLFEFGLGNLNSRTFFKDFWDVLSPEYKISRITPSGARLAVGAYYEDLEYFRGITNYVAELKSHPLRPVEA